MAIEIIIPRLGWSMEEGKFVAWLKQEGEIVQAGEALFSIEGDKAVQEIESIDSGILRVVPNAPAPGETIHVGDLLGYLPPQAKKCLRELRHLSIQSLRSSLGPPALH
jgi:pyruvate dehydrogenase E2 component (dihydrolipoamide acetyltransferase)